ncbi:MAG: GNAT family N-acetyltransferase [Planctomycetes bacterium]|nr:GNAT family N-acetyltransferase [Planctomycetota bacterium]
MSTAHADSVILRSVVADDVDTLFDYHMDADSIRMAAFPPRSREDFNRHWAGVIVNTEAITKAILHDGQLAGYVCGFTREGERLIGYWLGQRHWGKGIASRAVAQFIAYEPHRPLIAHVAVHNVASIRVLIKCGFVEFGRDRAAAITGGDVVEEVLLRLD